MKIYTFQKAFPDLDFDSLPLSSIPRIRVLFPKKSFHSMQKDLDFLLSSIFSNTWQLFTLNQFFKHPKRKHPYRPFVRELDNILGGIDRCDDLLIEETDYATIYNRIFPISYECMLRLSILDAWWRTKYREKNGLPFIEMDNFLFSERLDRLVYVNFILLTVPDVDGVDIASYNTEYLLSLSEMYTHHGFEVLTDRIECV